MRLVVLASLVAIALCCPRADADPARAWTVAREHLPATSTGVLALDVDKALTSTSLASFVTPFVATFGAGATLDALQKTCGIDPKTAIDGVVLVTGRADTGVFVLALDGLDEAAVLACATKLAAARTAEAPAPAVREDGAIRSLALGDRTLYARWLAPDVLAVPVRANDKTMLSTFTSGRGFRTSALAKLVARADTGAAIWFATTQSRAAQGRTMKSGYGSLAIAAKTLTLSATMTFASAREATAISTLVSDQIVALLASGRLDAIVMEMLNKVSIATKGAELAVTGSLPDDQLLPLIGALSGR